MTKLEGASVYVGEQKKENKCSVYVGVQKKEKKERD